MLVSGSKSNPPVSDVGRSQRHELFISYSHQDEKWLERLRTHLNPLESLYGLERWDDSLIQPGDQWLKEIEAALARAQVALLLVSPDFLASEFIQRKELPALFRLAEEDGLRILWLPLRPSSWRLCPDIEKYQAIIPPDKSLAQMSKVNQDIAMVEITKKIQSIFTDSQINDGIGSNTSNLCLNSTMFGLSPEKARVPDAKESERQGGKDTKDKQKRRRGILITYCHEDTRWLELIKEALAPLAGIGQLSLWEDTQIKPDSKWRDDIKKALDSANVALLLVSLAFLASEFIESSELPILLESAEKEGLIIRLVVLENCPFDFTDLKVYQSLWDVAKPLSGLSLAKRTEALNEIKSKIMYLQQRAEPKKRNGILIAYSHADTKWLELIREFLAPAIPSCQLSFYEDRQFKPGHKWRSHIEKSLDSVQVALLLVSEAFLVSEWTASDELPELLEEAKKKGLSVQIVVLDDCLHDYSGYRNFEYLEGANMPLASLPTLRRDEAIIRMVRKIIDFVRDTQPIDDLKD